MKTASEIKEMIAMLCDPQMRGEAREALIEEGTSAIPLLIDALRDQSTSLEAAEVLKSIGTDAVASLVAALDQKKTSAYAAIILEDIGEPSVEPLISAMESKSVRKSILIVRALGNIGDERAVGRISTFLLEQILAGNREGLLEVTIESLRRLGLGNEMEKYNSMDEFVKGIEGNGFKKSSRSERLYYHPGLPDVRLAIGKRIVRLERRGIPRKERKWELVRSFSIVHERKPVMILVRALSTITTAI